MFKINRLNLNRSFLLFIVFIGSVGCDCQPTTPSEPVSNNDGGSNQNNSGNQSQSLPVPITQDMINAVAVAPGIQDLLRDLQAGNNVDLNQPINSKGRHRNIPVNDLPLNIMVEIITNVGFGAYASLGPNRLEVIESLLSRGANSNPDITPSGSPTMPLIFYVILNKEDEIFKLLLRYKGANFNRQLNGETPYGYADRILPGHPAMHKSFMDAFAAAGINS